MYNESQKLRYIDYKENKVGTIMSLGNLQQKFNKSEVYEEKLGKDLCNFNAYEIADMYSRIGIASYSSLIVLNSTYSLYTDWCVGEGLVFDKINHFKAEMTMDRLKQLVNAGAAKKRIVTREEILDLCSQMENPSDAFCILALYEGYRGDRYYDIVESKISDYERIDGKCFCHLPSGRTIDISQELYHLAHSANESMTYTSFGGENAKIYELQENGYILKFKKSQKNTDPERKGKTLYFRLRRIFHHYNSDWMIGNALYESGRLAMIKEKAAEHKMKPIDYIYSDLIKEVFDRYPPAFQKSVYVRKYEKELG